jgi:hypothetical protein
LGTHSEEDVKKARIDIDTNIPHTGQPLALQDQPSEEQCPPAPIPLEKTPQEFYAEITARSDVRTILAELATG